MFRRIQAIAASLVLACVTPSVRAQDSMQDRLSGDRIARVDPGAYAAGDKMGFNLDSLGSEFLLRIDGTSEVFVLYPSRASMGQRILRYDSGETAIVVAGWGNMTLYTDAQPGGLPAMRMGDSVPPEPPPLSVPELQSAAAEETQRLADARHVDIAFTADWNALLGDAVARGVAYDAMENAERGLSRFACSHSTHDALAKRVEQVSLQIGYQPLLSLSGRTLVVTFNPALGYEGRASSRAIARALVEIVKSK
jgi:hypothetical protein